MLLKKSLKTENKILIFCGLAVLGTVIFARLSCQEKPVFNTDKFEAAILQLELENNILRKLAQENEDSAQVYKNKAQKVLIKYSTIRRTDTLNLRFTDSNYCKDLELQNDDLFAAIYFDSVAISSLKQHIVKDSVIKSNLWAVNAELKENNRDLNGEVNKQSYRKKLWRSASLVLTAILTYISIK